MQKSIIDKKLQNTVTLLILFIIIIFGVFFGVIKSKSKELKNTNIELSAKERELIAKEDKLKDLKTLENSIDEKRTQSDILIKALPTGEDLPGLLVQMESIAKRLKITLSSFSLPSTDGADTATASQQQSDLGVGDTTTTPTDSAQSSYTVKTMSFPFGMTGKYSSIIEFLEVLQKNLRIFTINSINIGGAGEESDQFTVSVDITTYYIDGNSPQTNQGTSEVAE
ncbi:type 4a pilus biogenesis protein PilO [Patescibacteria group bacterium]